MKFSKGATGSVLSFLFLSSISIAGAPKDALPGLLDKANAALKLEGNFESKIVGKCIKAKKALDAYNALLDSRYKNVKTLQDAISELAIEKAPLDLALAAQQSAGATAQGNLNADNRLLANDKLIQRKNDLTNSLIPNKEKEVSDANAAFVAVQPIPSDLTIAMYAARVAGLFDIWRGKQNELDALNAELDKLTEISGVVTADDIAAVNTDIAKNQADLAVANSQVNSLYNQIQSIQKDIDAKNAAIAKTRPLGSPVDKQLPSVCLTILPH